MGAVKNHYHDKILEAASIEDLGGEALCDECGEELDCSPNIEAFEVLDQLLCDDCAERALADNGQFGVGA